MPDDDPADALTDRQRQILDAVATHGFVTIEALARSFTVSTQTVRRDIIALSAANLLQRFHGGAGIGTEAPAVRLAHGYKQTLAAQAKRMIGRKAAALVPPGASVFLDVGTTIEAAAEALGALKGLTVFTNSLRAATLFSHDRHTVHVLGGQLAGLDGSLVGEAAVKILLGLRTDFAMIGCSGIEPGGAVMDFDLRKIAIKQAALQTARQKCLLVTRNKLGRSALAQIATRDDFDHILSDDAAA